MKMFMFSLYGDARQWYFSLPPSSISSLKDFHSTFTEHCKRYFSDDFAFDNCCDEYELHCKLEDVNIERALPHNIQQPFNDLQDVVFSHQHELQMDNKETECSLTILKSDCYEFEEMVPLATQRDDHEYIHDVLNDSFEEYVATGDIYLCNQDIGGLQVDNHSIDAFDIVSNASINLGCLEDEIVPFENPKGDYQIDTLVGDSLRSATDSKGRPPLSDLQFKRNGSDYEEQDFQKTSNLQERQQEDYISPYVSYMSMSDEKDEYDEVKDDMFSNLFQDPIADDSMLESSSLSLEIILDVPIFDKYGDEEGDFKSWEGLLTTKVSSSPTFQQRDC
jgi:hypothetical protein